MTLALPSPHQLTHLHLQELVKSLWCREVHHPPALPTPPPSDQLARNSVILGLFPEVTWNHCSMGNVRAKTWVYPGSSHTQPKVLPLGLSCSRLFSVLSLQLHLRGWQAQETLCPAHRRWGQGPECQVKEGA